MKYIRVEQVIIQEADRWARGGCHPETRDKGEKQKHTRGGEQLITDGVQRGLRPRPSLATFAKKKVWNTF